MANFRNALEILVVRAAQRELEQLALCGSRSQANLVEVVAYTLNRLPPMYATTQRGWLRHREQVLKTMQPQIVDTIAKAIKTLSMGDPLHDDHPIPDSEYKCKSMSLVRLHRILGNSNLDWKDVPGALSQTLSKIEGENYSFATVPDLRATSPVFALSPSRRETIAEVVSYVNRKKAAKQPRGSTIKRIGKQNENLVGQTLSDHDLTRKTDALEIYTLKAILGFSNVLENLVLSAANALMQQIEAEMRSQINVSEVAAYALNRLPPMYASSERGWQVLRRKAKEQLSREIVVKVREAIVRVLNQPKTSPQPLPFQRFDQEYDDALLQLAMILQREDLTWLNVADLVEQEVARVRNSPKSF